MSFDNIFAVTNISASGLSAERFRMEVVANNIANAYSTRSPNGGPYRRQEVVFSALLNNALGTDEPQLAGVQVLGVVPDQSEFQPVYKPGHPDADRNGFVLMPNVQLPVEMVDLITANRAYEANLKVLRAFRQQAEMALSLGRFQG